MLGMNELFGHTPILSMIERFVDDDDTISQ
jgi:hypothetical protein